MAQPAGAGAGAGGGRGRELRMSIEEVAKKLSLWHTATFRPILTHDELEPILALAGFVPAPPAPAPTNGQQEAECPPAGGGVAWREYAYLGCNADAVAAARRRRRAGPGPRPRLPYPRVDGLHLKTYEAFLGAVEACLGADRVSNLFHVRLMPVTNPHDRAFDKVFRPMRNFTPEEDGLIVYREGTLDDLTFEMCSHHGAIGDLGHHVIPGISCSDLGYLRKVDGNCHLEGCCARYPATAAVAAAGCDFFTVHVKDLFPKY
ncbi:hypothetical protein SEVIR_6G214600v4 [Setaria viridis]|uniref:Uncharacterized protein n=1 Tax=Setaria viridis TaxID=4556 RepID=A0A4U6U7Q7_SETVI|nr:uncharacterized protein LOC117860338 [Setaria viridis]TKW11142.1 hypothetical protein SEVIR_6G214600v2 [Setaria viridis]